MSTWHEEREAERTRLRDTLERIATALGDGWTVDAPHDSGARLITPGGVRIWANVETYGAHKGKLHLTGGLPDGADYSAGDYGRHDDKSPEIRVSMDRDPEAIARDITRRLADRACTYWTAVSERIASRTAAAGAREALARELAAIMGSDARERRNDWEADLPPALAGEPYTYGGMVPNYGADSVTVEIRNATPDQARELARVIRAWTEGVK